MPTWDSFQQFLDDAMAAGSDNERQELVNELLSEREDWPWVEGNRATFIFSKMGVQSVALNLDTIPEDPPFAPMENLPGTTLWYVQRPFEMDTLLDYMLAVDDPGTPLRQEKDMIGRIARHWQADPRNPRRMSTAQMEVSVLQMPHARPFPNWQKMPNVPKGQIFEHRFDSVQMGFENRKIWVYTPPGYDPEAGIQYPMLVLMDGQWMVGPVQTPYIADTLIKHGRMEPVIIAMLQSGSQQDRIQDYVSNDKQYAAVLTEVLPFLQSHYLIDSTNLGIGGVGVGAIAAAHAALSNPAVFRHLIMLSPPLGKGVAEEKLIGYIMRFEQAPVLPSRIFQSVGRYEVKSRFYLPGRALAVRLMNRQEGRGDINFRFVEVGSGHGLVAFRSVMPEALAHVFPGETGA